MALLPPDALVLDDHIKMRESMLNDSLPLAPMSATEPNGNPALYYFKEVTATISSFSHEPVVIKF